MKNRAPTHGDQILPVVLPGDTQQKTISALDHAKNRAAPARGLAIIPACALANEEILLILPPWPPRSP